MGFPASVALRIAQIFYCLNCKKIRPKLDVTVEGIDMKANNADFKGTHRAGYTLVEMLVAIAIVGILASLLLTTLAHAKMRARQTICMSNMKQLGVAFISYSHDHGETVPYEKKGGNSGWVGFMKSYGVTDEVLHCPMCEKTNKHSLGGMRKNWRAGNVGDAEVAADLPTGVAMGNDAPADEDSNVNYPGRDWARHPNYWRFVTGNFGRDEKAVFTLHHERPGCSEHKGAHNPHWSLKPYKSACPPFQMITPPPWNYNPKCKGGSTVVLVICENVKPSGFGLKICDAKSGQRLDSIPGVKVDDWELFEWGGPLAKSLGGEGSLLSPAKPFHKKPIGFEQATPLGRHTLHQGKYYPDAPDGEGIINYIYMRTTIHSSIDQKLEIAVTGDEAYSVFFLGSDSGCSGEPGTPCDPGEPTTSSYGINAFVQSSHHHAEHEPRKFVEIPEHLRSSTPLFVEANWAWVMPSPQDLPPATLDGGYGGIQRVILNRHDKHVNIVYGDGHAAPVKLRELYTQEWYPRCKMMRGLTIPKLPNH